MGNPNDGECLAVGCTTKGTLYGMFCGHHSGTPEDIGHLRDVTKSLRTDNARLKRELEELTEQYQRWKDNDPYMTGRYDKIARERDELSEKLGAADGEG